MYTNRLSTIIQLILLLLVASCARGEQTTPDEPVLIVEETPGDQPRIKLESSPTSAVKTYSIGDSMIRPTDKMIMVFVPGDTFQMGSSEEQIESAIAMCEQYPTQWDKCDQSLFMIESPQHTVKVSDFWLDRTEVTNSQYQSCVDSSSCQPSRLANNQTYNGNNYPVAGVPWQAAVQYCTWAGGSLPTEAEWEFASKGVQNLIFPWGEEFSCSGGNFYDQSTGCEDGYPGPSPVGSFPSGVSWSGAHDMAGNVWEWVVDEFREYATDVQSENNQEISEASRILRGGSWAYTPSFLRTSYRYRVPADADYLAVGFRCVIPIDDQKSD